MSSVTISPHDVKLELQEDSDDEFPFMTDVTVDIMLKNEKVGYINAVVVDRTRIDEDMFLSAMDEYSGDMQWLGVVLFEPKYGRTKLQSLHGYDDMQFDFAYIKSFHIEPEYRKDGSSDVGAIALSKFLRHPCIKGNLDHGCWKVSSVIYVLDSSEAMSQEEAREHEAYQSINRNRMYEDQNILDTEQEKAEKQRWGNRLDQLDRMDANQFLRNGFFQDKVYAEDSKTQARILVASYHHWDQPMKSHEEATRIQFCEPREAVKPTGLDAELLNFVLTECSTSTEVNRIRTGIDRLIRLGASVARSTALHFACGRNNYAVMDILIQLEPSAANAVDGSGLTPLMVAASSAAQGCADVRLISRLLAAGASKDSQTAKGVTAYGLFKNTRKDLELAMFAMTGGAVSSAGDDPSMKVIEQMLRPLNPTRADLGGGEGPDSGFVDYTLEDEEDE